MITEGAQFPVQEWVTQTGEIVERHIGYQELELRLFNLAIASEAIQAITARRQSLLAKKQLRASLPFKMSARADPPFTFAPEGIRKKPMLPDLGKASGKAIPPEASLSDEQFEDILRTIRAIGYSTERTPAAFAKLEEEGIRSVFLAALNAQFAGAATGETFNASGKTDILVRCEDRNLFIAECKNWDGPASLTEAVDQVQGYLSWRDSSAAVLLFVRKTSMGTVLPKVPRRIEAHSLCVRRLRTIGEAEWQYRFAQKANSDRELTLAVLAFHLPI